MINKKEEFIMRILVFGAGVLGSNLAKNLFCAGKDVTLLARGKWAEEIKSNGLRIKNKLTSKVSVSRIPVKTELKSDDEYDVIFVSVRYTQIDSLIDTLKANKTKNIVFLGNNVRAEKLTEILAGKNVMFAFASSAGYRESNLVVSADLRKITIGQIKGCHDNLELINSIFEETKYKVSYEHNMGDYLLCHAAFVVPSVFACYKTGGNLKAIKHNNEYLNRLIDANIEAYRAIKNAGHEILPDSDKDFESAKYRKTCFRFFKLMCYTALGKICLCDHAMNATDEMSALNRDLKEFFDKNKADYPVWKELERECGDYLK